MTKRLVGKIKKRTLYRESYRSGVPFEPTGEGFERVLEALRQTHTRDRVFILSEGQEEFVLTDRSEQHHYVELRIYTS